MQPGDTTVKPAAGSFQVLVPTHSMALQATAGLWDNRSSKPILAPSMHLTVSIGPEGAPSRGICRPQIHPDLVPKCCQQRRTYKEQLMPQCDNFTPPHLLRAPIAVASCIPQHTPSYQHRLKLGHPHNPPNHGGPL